MNTFPNNDVYFPIIYPDIHTGFGFFARRTKIHPLDDIDLMFGLDGDDCVYSESDGKIIITAREGTVRLKYYKHDGTNFINSRKIINSFISSLNQIQQYDRADVKKNQEAATLKLKSYDWNFDIVPAFITTPDSFGKTYYLIPNGNGHNVISVFIFQLIALSIKGGFDFKKTKMIREIISNFINESLKMNAFTTSTLS